MSQVKLVFGPAHGKVAEFAQGMKERAFRLKPRGIKQAGLILPSHARGVMVKYRRIGTVNGKEMAVFVNEETI